MMKCLLLFNVFYLILAGLVIIIICHCLKMFSNILESFYNNDCNSDIVRALRNTSPATESKSFLEYLRKHRLSRAVFHQLDNVTKVKIYNNYHQERTLAK